MLSLGGSHHESWVHTKIGQNMENYTSTIEWMFRTKRPSFGWINPHLSLSSFMMARISWLIGPMMNWQKARCKGSVQPSGCCTLVQTCRKKKGEPGIPKQGLPLLNMRLESVRFSSFFWYRPKKIPQRHVQNLNQLTSFHPPSSWHWRKSHPTCVASSSPSPHPSSEHRSWQIAPQSGWYVDKNKLNRSFVSEMLQSPPQVAYHFYQPIFSSHDLNL